MNGQDDRGNDNRARVDIVELRSDLRHIKQDLEKLSLELLAQLRQIVGDMKEEVRQIRDVELSNLRRDNKAIQEEFKARIDALNNDNIILKTKMSTITWVGSLIGSAVILFMIGSFLSSITNHQIAPGVERPHTQSSYLLPEVG